ncbi:carboxylesterase/lipase family protein [Parvularcula sp. LCG005]|uniref:carboxylesterase/lipase family protein n=1 Tax=Parvularcula sp. LCG005 TaxID=3078805 RepID=UPI002943DBFD|nr:carboxylesterase/lipase family protein [Parvularcula sp. LCG005]WOI52396.1 carboxylesterase/lipase family protein [Parvularcula sp. LCG005]
MSGKRLNSPYLDRRTFIAGVSALPLGASAALGQGRQDPRMQTSFGPVSGYNDGPVSVFKGVRYGGDTRPRRFQRPVAPTAWTEVKRATEYGGASPQRGSEPNQSEDCLFLNVWTPGVADGAKRPIMVYFHGGAYNGGSGSDPLYDGRRLAEIHDVVVVTVNHRLNVFGYLYLPVLTGGKFPDSGNTGIWDLVLALEWVRDNADAIGGDAKRVMVFGQSGGGAKIATMMAAPAAKGLFHSAATMSGQQVTACGPLNGTARAGAVLNQLGIAPDDIGALVNLPTERLLDGMEARDPVNPEFGVYMGPVLDEIFLKRHPFWPDAPAQSADIPMILGNTKDETRNLIGRREPDAFDMEWDELPARLAHHMRCDILPSEVVSVYRKAYPDYSAADIFFAATTAGRSWRGQVEEADARARAEHPTWVYQMDLPSPEEGGRYGAPHTIDIAHAFGNLTAPNAITGNSARARVVSDQLQAAFVALARNGTPDHKGLPTWSQHRLPDRATMVFGDDTKLVDDPRKVERELFAKVPFIQWGT